MVAWSCVATEYGVFLSHSFQNAELVLATRVFAKECNGCQVVCSDGIRIVSWLHCRIGQHGKFARIAFVA